jgi:hypothetical protein
MWPCILGKQSPDISKDRNTPILIIKANEMHNFSNLFDKSTLHVSDSSTVHHQEYLNTVYTQYMLVLLAVASRRQQN